MAGAPRFWELLTETEQAALRAAGRSVLFRAGRSLLRQGEPPGRAAVLERGRARVTVDSADGGATLLAVRLAGDLVGEQSVIHGTPCDATVRAMDEVEALVMPREAFLRVLEEHPRVLSAAFRMVSRRLEESDRKRVLTGASVVARVADALLDLLSSAERGEIACSHEDLAQLTGASRESVTRALTRLRGHGLLTTGRRRITVSDADGLERFAAR